MLEGSIYLDQQERKTLYCEADFDTILDGRNVGDYSDLEINQIQASAGFTYLISPQMSLYGKYIYHESTKVRKHEMALMEFHTLTL